MLRYDFDDVHWICCPYDEKQQTVNVASQQAHLLHVHLRRNHRLVGNDHPLGLSRADLLFQTRRALPYDYFLEYV